MNFCFLQNIFEVYEGFLFLERWNFLKLLCFWNNRYVSMHKGRVAWSHPVTEKQFLLNPLKAGFVVTEDFQIITKNASLFHGCF